MTVKHITTNSNEVKDGSIFIALRGSVFNGHNFIESAILKGASTIYYSEPTKFLTLSYPNVEFIFDKNLEHNLPQILKSFYTLPSKIIAITGTNGKTSTASFTMQSLAKLGLPSGFIGTLGVFIHKSKTEKLFTSELTTPDTVSFYYFLALLKSKGIDHVVFEASSIGIAKRRMRGLNIEVACFLNFTQDHLDFHQTMENYFEAKALLFKEFLSPKGVAIFNSDKFPKIKEITDQRGIKAINPKSAESIKTKPQSSEFVYGGQNFKLKLSGVFQIENILFVINICSYFGFSLSQIAKITPSLKAPQGRLECVNQSPHIFIDYAHTPDSLLKAIQTLKSFCTGKVIVVFGCGGGRDKKKRLLMGKVAYKTADFSIITDDNPRSENAQKIRQSIIEGFADTEGLHEEKFIEVAGRKDAIKFAISKATLEDSILIAGKGHEDYQIIGKKKHYFSDTKCVLGLLKKPPIKTPAELPAKPPTNSLEEA